MIAERCTVARRSATSAAVLLALAALAVVRPAAQQQVLPGDPLSGLTPVGLEEFRLGLDDFLEVENAEEGLGPAYNNTSSAGCHNVPAIGGIAPMTTTRAGIRERDGTYRDVEPASGSLFQIFSIPTHACQSVIPPEANAGRRRAGRAPDAAAVGAALPAPVAARWQRGDGGRRGPAARERGGPGAGRFRAARAGRSRGAGGVSRFAVGGPDSLRGEAVAAVVRFCRACRRPAPSRTT